MYVLLVRTQGLGVLNNMPCLSVLIATYATHESKDELLFILLWLSQTAEHCIDLSFSILNFQDKERGQVM